VVYLPLCEGLLLWVPLSVDTCGCRCSGLSGRDCVADIVCGCRASVRALLSSWCSWTRSTISWVLHDASLICVPHPVVGP
jgi:hypothetical protein